MSRRTGGSAGWFALVLVLALAAGCGEPARENVVVRDSAGVRIVEHPVEPPAGAGARPLPAPELVLGTALGEGPQAFDRVDGAIRLSDGTVVVGDRGTLELHWFGPGGEHRARAGGEGGGPGELERLRGLARWRGDTVVALDGSGPTLEIYAPDGTFVRSERPLRDPEGTSWSVQLAGVAGERTLVLRGGRIFGPRQVRERGSGVFRDTVPVLLRAGTGAPLDTLGFFPGQTYQLEVREGGFTVRTLSLRPNLRIAAAGDRIHLGTGDSREIRTYGVDGDLARLVRGGRRGGAVTAEIREAYVDAVAERVGDRVDEQALRRRFREWPWPDRMPAHDYLAADAAGGVWVRSFPPPGADSATWNVYGPDGREEGRWRAPASLRILSVEDRIVLALDRDDLGVDRIQVHRLPE